MRFRKWKFSRLRWLKPRRWGRHWPFTRRGMSARRAVPGYSTRLLQDAGSFVRHQFPNQCVELTQGQTTTLTRNCNAGFEMIVAAFTSMQRCWASGTVVFVRSETSCGLQCTRPVTRCYRSTPWLALLRSDDHACFAYSGIGNTCFTRCARWGDRRRHTRTCRSMRQQQRGSRRVQ